MGREPAQTFTAMRSIQEDILTRDQMPPTTAQIEVSSAIATAVKWLISAAAAIIISVPFAIRLLAALLMVKFFVSLFNPARKLRETVTRSALAMILCLTCHYVFVVGQQQTGLNVGFNVDAMITGFYILQTGLAIIINCSMAGLEIPPALLDMLIKADGMTNLDRAEVTALKLKQQQESAALSLKQNPSDEDWHFLTKNNPPDD